MKRFILAVFMILVSSTISYSNEDKTLWINEQGEATHFNMCDCMEQGFKNYPSTRQDVMEAKCRDVYIKELMKQSKAEDRVIQASFYSCNK